jgi:hypothetical protein
MSHYTSGCYINDANTKIREASDWLPAFKHKSKQTTIDNSPTSIIIGIENRLNLSICDTYLKKINSIYISNSVKVKKISLIRHFPNLIASHLRAWGGQKYHEGMADEWNKHYDLSINHKDIYRLIYDQWLDSDYRNDLAKTIGFINQDFGIDQIPHYGGGSSFKDKVVNRDNLKNRWKTMVKNDRFMTIMKNFPYWHKHIKIFGKDEAYNFFN